MNRRSFLASLLGVGAGLVLPEPPRVRAYSFMPGLWNPTEAELLAEAERRARALMRQPLHSTLGYHNGYEDIEVTFRTGDRVLLKGSAKQEENGLWVVTAVMPGVVKHMELDFGFEEPRA